MKKVNKIFTEPPEFTNWNECFKFLTELKGDWLYRGQSSSSDLETSLEHECKKSNFLLKTDAKKIEDNMIRQFQRVYDGDDQQFVKEDTLYCLSLMRHYGAPVRLLDFTYSVYMAMYFALEAAYDNIHQEHDQPDYEASRNCVIWCIEQKELWNKKRGVDVKVKELLEFRKDDDKRNDKTFVPLYMNNDYDFVSWENPTKLHRRLHLQQGVFLCPGNINIPFMKCLLAPYGTETTDKIIKVKCKFKPLELRKAFRKFMRMNITRESLFPGLDGFSKSMTYQLWFYTKLHDWRKGNYDASSIGIPN